MNEEPILQGEHVRLEPLSLDHVPELAKAAESDRSLYRWSPVPHGRSQTTQYVETAISWRRAGTALPFATIRVADGALVGSTRFWNLERWAWPASHLRHGREACDACEIGYSWLTQSAIRTAANTESKFLMLTHAFEVWQVLRVCFHADARNTRSRAALERIGGKFEGILRSHRMAADYIARDSARYSILSCEWPDIKRSLQEKLAQHRAAGEPKV